MWEGIRRGEEAFSRSNVAERPSILWHGHECESLQPFLRIPRIPTCTKRDLSASQVHARATQPVVSSGRRQFSGTASQHPLFRSSQASLSEQANIHRTTVVPGSRFRPQTEHGSEGSEVPWSKSRLPARHHTTPLGAKANYWPPERFLSNWRLGANSDPNLCAVFVETLGVPTPCVKGRLVFCLRT